MVLAGVGAVGILLHGPSTRAMNLVNQSPAVSEIGIGSALAFALRFDEPVDHRRSTLRLVTPGGEVAVHARLEAEPNTLYVALGRLTPGDYTLRWQAHEADGDHVVMGTIPFKVVP